LRDFNNLIKMLRDLRVNSCDPIFLLFHQFSSSQAPNNDKTIKQEASEAPERAQSQASSLSQKSGNGLRTMLGGPPPLPPPQQDPRPPAPHQQFGGHQQHQEPQEQEQQEQEQQEQQQHQQQQHQQQQQYGGHHQQQQYGGVNPMFQQGQQQQGGYPQQQQPGPSGYQNYGGR
jgi:hypothetical protein